MLGTLALVRREQLPARRDLGRIALFGLLWLGRLQRRVERGGASSRRGNGGDARERRTDPVRAVWPACSCVKCFHAGLLAGRVSASPGRRSRRGDVADGVSRRVGGGEAASSLLAFGAVPSSRCGWSAACRRQVMDRADAATLRAFSLPGERSRVSRTRAEVARVDGRSACSRLRGFRPCRATCSSPTTAGAGSSTYLATRGCGRCSAGPFGRAPPGLARVGGALPGRREPRSPIGRSSAGRPGGVQTATPTSASR